MTTRRTLRETHPALSEEWHPTKNSFSPDEFMPRVDDKVWWQCPIDARHEWPATVRSRAKGAGCLVCANRLVVAGVNDLATTHPELAAQWHEDNVLPASEVGAGTNHEYLWQCSANISHVWPARVKNRAKMGVGCPFCSGKKVAPENSLAVARPDIAAEWHPELNDCSPSEVTQRSGLDAWWLCSKNAAHVWLAVVGNRTAAKGTGCPFCANRRIIADENSLAFLLPDLAAEWHPGNLLGPDEVAPASNKPAWWVCPLGHEWKTSPAQRVVKLRGCAVCANQRVLLGFNDAATTNPDLLAEWADPDVLPTDVTAGSRAEILWRCEAGGHEWRRPVSARSGTRPAGCPDCNASSFSSKFEKEIAAYIQGLLPDETVETTRRGLIQNGRFNELDIYVPSLKIAVECNGVYWHSEGAGKSRDFHRTKFDACVAAGIQLIQVWEDDWASRQETVKAMLAHKLGVSSMRTVFARKTAAVEITHAEASVFLDAHHIQGAVAGSFYLGLRERSTGELLAVMVLKRQGGKDATVFRLERYATAARVPGGHSKLVAYAERHINGWTELVTFADLEVSDGSLYTATGWIRDAELRPDYRYVVGSTRRHKFGYRLARFRDDPKLKYEPGLTERELAALNNLHRVWDSGKVRFKYLRTVG